MKQIVQGGWGDGIFPYQQIFAGAPEYPIEAQSDYGVACVLFGELGASKGEIQAAVSEWLRRYPDPLTQPGKKGWAVAASREARRITSS